MAVIGRKYYKMIPVTQTKVVVKKSNGEYVVRGNCYAACIASLLGLPITEVPNIEVLYGIDNTYYWEVLCKWLGHLGYELSTDNRFKSCFHEDFQDMNFGGEDRHAAWRKELYDKYYLVSGKSPRGIQHICIYQNGKLVHDPHPSREGLINEEDFQSLTKL